MNWPLEPRDKEERLEFWEALLWAFVILLSGFIIASYEGYAHGLF